MRIFFLLLFTCTLLLETSWATNPTPLEDAKSTMQAGRYATAIEKLRVVLEKEPSNYHAWFLFGVSHALEQQYNQAIEAFRQVVVLRPDLAEPHNNLAGVYSALGDPKMAIHELEIALEKHPDYAIAEENIANLYIDLALKHYRNSLDKIPNSEVEQRFARLLQVRDPANNNRSSIRDALHQAEQKTAVKQSPPPAIKKAEPLVVAKIVQPAPPSTNKATETHSITSVLDALEAWRMAWSSQDVQTYFATYSQNYQPAERFPSYEAWRAYKKRVIQNKTFIQVDFDQVEVNIKGNTATVTMLQRFRSDSYNGDGRKKMIFQFADQRWEIITEASI